jgi:hypothetical protein
VYYQNGNVVHSGIITQKNSNTISGITVVSKWGYVGHNVEINKHIVEVPQ